MVKTGATARRSMERSAGETGTDATGFRRQRFVSSQIFQVKSWEISFGAVSNVSMQQLTTCHDGVHTLKHPPLILFWFLTQARQQLFISLWLKPSIRDEEERDNISDWAEGSTKECRFWEEALLICSWHTLFCWLHGWSFSLCPFVTFSLFQ